MACAIYLIYSDQQRVAVAVNRDGFHMLHMSRCLPFVPDPLSTTGEERDETAGKRAGECLVVHPAEHQHFVGVVLLDDGREQAVLVAFEPCGDGGGKRRGWFCRANRMA